MVVVVFVVIVVVMVKLAWLYCYYLRQWSGGYIIMKGFFLICFFKDYELIMMKF